jgi:hypothetical protein
MNEPLEALPAGTEKTLKREQWNQYAKAFKAQKALSKPEWQAFLALTRELAETAENGEPNYWEEAKKAGAFAMDRVPRCTPAEIIVRVQQVTDWIIGGRSTGYMMQEALKRWGVGVNRRV